MDFLSIDSIKEQFYKKLLSQVRFPDTSILKAVRKNLSLKDSISKSHVSIFKINPISSHSLLQSESGYLDYEYSYRSYIDTPFNENGIGQHFISGHWNVTVAQSFPITISYFERETNSNYFKNYRIIRAEFNSLRYQQNQSEKIKNYVKGLTEQLRNPLTKPLLSQFSNQSFQIEEWLHSTQILNLLFHSRSALFNSQLIDSTKYNKDTVVKKAGEFIAFYEKATKEYNRVIQQKDSLQKDFVRTEKKIQLIKQLISGPLITEYQLDRIKKLLNEEDIFLDNLNKYAALLSSVKKLAVGSVFPNYSDLTVKNLNVNGIDWEYERKLYIALSAGTVDYRSRDFFYNRQNTHPQFLISARIGYGKREGSHLFITAFRGKKQLLSTEVNHNSFDIYGLGLESQIKIDRHRLTMELVQSVSPTLISTSSSEKTTTNWRDPNNKAWKIQYHGLIPSIHIQVDGFYQYKGIYFQNFTSYYTNAAQHSWRLHADEYFWKRKLHLTASIEQNNYENNYLPVRYEGNTLFRQLNLSIGFRPGSSFSLGYQPASQLSNINGIIYQNFYQTLTLMGVHRYKLGWSEALTTLSYNRFFNHSTDSGFLYYNASNLYLDQTFQFVGYTANVGITHSINSGYDWTILQGGVQARVFHQQMAGVGIKIHQLNQQQVQVGFYGNAQVAIKNLGVIRGSAERSFIPSWKAGLVETEFYSLGFIRYFK